MTNDASKFVLMMVVVSVTLIIGVYILATMQTTFTNTVGATVINESMSNFTVAGNFVANSGQFGFSQPVIIRLINATSAGDIVPASNYTISAVGLVQAVAGSPWLNHRVNVTYSYSYQTTTPQGNTSGTALIALNGGTSWLTILVVVGFAVLVLVLLNKGLGGAGSSSGGNNVYEPVAY